MTMRKHEQETGGNHGEPIQTAHTSVTLRLDKKKTSVEAGLLLFIS